MFVRDDQRYPMAWMGWTGGARISALDRAEEATGRRLPPASASRLTERERRQGAHIRHMKLLRNDLSRIFG